MKGAETRGNVNYLPREALGEPLFKVVRASHVREPQTNGSHPTEQTIHAGVTVEFPGGYHHHAGSSAATVEKAYLGAYQQAVGEAYAEAHDVSSVRFTAQADTTGQTTWAVRTNARGVAMLSVMNGNMAPTEGMLGYRTDPLGYAVGQAIHDSVLHQIRHPKPERQEPHKGHTVFVVK